MEKLTDEDIQLLLDANSKIESSDEVEMYQKVFNELSAIPDIPVSDLAGNVVSVLKKQNELIATIKTFTAIGFCVVFGLCAFMAGAFTIDKLIAMKLVSLMYRCKWVIVFFAVTNVIWAVERKSVSLFLKS